VSGHEAYFVTRTVRTLELLAAGPRSVAQIADSLAINERTARRMLYRLQDEAYVARVYGHGSPFSLAPRFSSLAARALASEATARSSVLHTTAGVGGAVSDVVVVVLPVQPSSDRPA
jgi:DNA-binding IclR family transcriptional regulator